MSRCRYLRSKNRKLEMLKISRRASGEERVVQIGKEETEDREDRDDRDGREGRTYTEKRNDGKERGRQWHRKRGKREGETA